MGTFKLTFSALFGLALVSCVPPKATPVTDVPVRVQKKTDESAVTPVPDLPAAAQTDDLRMPDLLRLPSDEDFRSAGPSKTSTDSGAVIARPPTDPPSRVKPKSETPADQR